MPKLVRLYMVNVAIGFGLSAVFVGLLLWLDVARLWHLVTATQGGWIAVLMLFVFNGLVFSGVQFAIVVMRMAAPDPGRGGGLRAPLHPSEALEPVRAEARSGR
jgi:hypothetical protein